LPYLPVATRPPRNKASWWYAIAPHCDHYWHKPIKQAIGFAMVKIILPRNSPKGANGQDDPKKYNCTVHKPNGDEQCHPIGIQQSPINVFFTICHWWVFVSACFIGHNGIDFGCHEDGLQQD